MNLNDLEERTSENCVRVFDIGRCGALDSYPFEIQELSSEPQVSFVHSLEGTQQSSQISSLEDVPTKR